MYKNKVLMKYYMGVKELVYYYYESPAYKQIFKVICLCMNYIIKVKPNVYVYDSSNHMKLPEAISIYYNVLVLSKNFLCKLNNCHMTYIIGANINNHLSISCNTFVIITD